ncbi:MAG: Bax inhibitor-1/YccA family protein [Bacteroidota bacterium]
MARRQFGKTSSNPFFGEKAFRENATNEPLDSGMIVRSESAPMTVQGAVNKSFILGGLMLITAFYSFFNPSSLFLWGGMIGGLVVVLVMSWKKHLAPTLGPIYALLEGLFVGSISAAYAYIEGGLIGQAIGLTMAVFFMMLFIYKAGIVKVTSKLRAGVMMATGAIMLMYVVVLVANFIFGASWDFLHNAGPLSIGISLVIIGVASFNLLLDFDNFEKGEQYRLPKYMEWFMATGLIVTLVWLYIEILRLLAILNSD